MPNENGHEGESLDAARESRFWQRAELASQEGMDAKRESCARRVQGLSGF